MKEFNSPDEEHAHHASRLALGGIIALVSLDLIVVTSEVFKDKWENAGKTLGAGAVVVGGLAVALDRWNKSNLR